jgi:Amt family ammonium transporter
MVVTQISAATAALTWMFLDVTDPAVGKPTCLGVATGAVAGLASITPAAGFVGPIGGLAIGLLGGVVCR